MSREILLVNCYRERAAEKIAGYRAWLEQAAAAASGEKFVVREALAGQAWPGSRESAAVILSGSQKMVGDGEVEPSLLEFLAANRKPLLGVCYGHQALAAAFGAWVRRDLASHLGEETVRIAAGGGIFSGFPASFPMHESHEEIVVRDPALKRNFALLAESGSGLVEAIAHRERPLFGVQFHPERSGELGVRLLANFLRIAQHEAANYRDA